ncbi:hypothetical protein D1822_14510 [Phaeobacter inhibens]|nr:hypothetical protein PhaeoP10_03002 [Phaeobacter inhibens]AXT23929.1 hypothetical protein D1822_14510 [Phaeobacter inhibens]
MVISVFLSFAVYVVISLMQSIRAYPNVVEGFQSQLEAWRVLPANLLHVPVNLHMLTSLIWMPVFFLSTWQLKQNSEPAQ